LRQLHKHGEGKQGEQRAAKGAQHLNEESLTGSELMECRERKLEATGRNTVRSLRCPDGYSTCLIESRARLQKGEAPEAQSRAGIGA
jgi:hypothetical protein